MNIPPSWIGFFFIAAVLAVLICPLLKSLDGKPKRKGKK